MQIFSDILNNSILISGAAAWCSAQILKTIIHAFVYRSLDPKRLLGDGGMPSSHSATVTAVAISTGITCGFSSPLFGLAMVFAFVVMHDASGVRLETGKQARILNDILADLYSDKFTPEEKLKEFVGHTHLQVLAGASLGLLIAILLNL